MSDLAAKVAARYMQAELPPGYQDWLFPIFKGEHRLVTKRTDPDTEREMISAIGQRGSERSIALLSRIRDAGHYPHLLTPPKGSVAYRGLANVTPDQLAALVGHQDANEAVGSRSITKTVPMGRNVSWSLSRSFATRFAAGTDGDSGPVMLKQDHFSVLLFADATANRFLLNPKNLKEIAETEFGRAGMQGTPSHRFQMLGYEKEVWPTKGVRLFRIRWHHHNVSTYHMRKRKEILRKIEKQRGWADRARPEVRLRIEKGIEQRLEEMEQKYPLGPRPADKVGDIAYFLGRG